MEAKPVRLPVDKYFVSKKIFHLKSFSRRNEKLIGILQTLTIWEASHRLAFQRNFLYHKQTSAEEFLDFSMEQDGAAEKKESFGHE